MRRITVGNGGWAAMYDQWSGESRTTGTALGGQAPDLLQQAARLASDNDEAANGGVFGFFPQATDCAALLHLTRDALPNTGGYTLQGHWVLLSPRFEAADRTWNEQAELAAGVIVGCLALSRRGALAAGRLRLLVGHAFDRPVVAGVAATLQRLGEAATVLHGRWIELTAHAPLPGPAGHPVGGPVVPASRRVS